MTLTEQNGEFRKALHRRDTDSRVGLVNGPTDMKDAAQRDLKDRGFRRTKKEDPFT